MNAGGSGDVWLRRGAAVGVAAGWLFVVERASHLAADTGPLGSPRALAVLFGVHGAAVSIAALAILAVTAVDARAGERARAVAGGSVAAALVAVPGVLLGASISSGDWVARQSFAPAIRWGIPLGLAAAAFGAAWLHLRPAGRRPPAWSWAVLAAAAAAADALVLPALYPAAHKALYGLAAIASTVAALTWLARGGAIARAPKWASIVGAGALVVGLLLFAILGRSTRSAVTAASPTTGGVLASVWPRGNAGTLAQALAKLPSKPEAEPRDAAHDGRRLAAPARSVLLILVDTLRGDALPPARTRSLPFSAKGDTPVLDAWLESSFRFRSAYAQSTKTKMSMPPMFRSIEASEDPASVGIPLPDRMRRAGLTPVAVVPEYFMQEAQPRAHALLSGFERVSVYPLAEQDELVPRATKVLEEVKDQPFFAWVHFFNMHSPQWSGRGAGREGTASKRYQAALRWLDGQLGALMAALDRLGLSSTTLVVLAADHGEHLGEGKRYGHGDGVHEEEVHVPLAFRVPGAQGAVVEGLAGNIDIVPTMLDLLGQPPAASVRGQSLVPLMRSPARASGRVYYAQSATGDLHAVVEEQSKLVYDEGAETIARYDRRKDPRDRKDLFGRRAAQDDPLVSALVRRNPDLFAPELREAKVRKAIEQRLAAVDPSRPPAHLELLLALAARVKTEAAIAEAARIFEAARDAEVRAAVAEHLFPTDPGAWSRRLGQALSPANGADEIALVSALRLRGQPAFGLDLAARRLDALASDPASPAARAWLGLTERWSKPRALFAGVLGRVIRAAALPAERPEDVEVLVSALAGAAMLEPRPQGEVLGRDLEEALLPLLDHPEARVAAAACDALASGGSTRARPALLAILEGRKRDASVRRAALRALAAVDGAAAVPVVLREGEDAAMSAEAIRILAGLRDARALPFLDATARDQQDVWLRQQAARAAAAVRR